MSDGLYCLPDTQINVTREVFEATAQLVDDHFPDDEPCAYLPNHNLPDGRNDGYIDLAYIGDDGILKITITPEDEVSPVWFATHLVFYPHSLPTGTKEQS